MFEFIFYLVVLLYDYLYIAELDEHSNRKLNFLWISKIIFKKQKSSNPVDYDAPFVAKMPFTRCFQR